MASIILVKSASQKRTAAPESTGRGVFHGATTLVNVKHATTKIEVEIKYHALSDLLPSE
jgi:hypothetical protein